MCIADELQATSFSPGETLQKLADDEFSFLIKGNIYNIKYV